MSERLRALARENLFLGTSSWKYEGWLGQIYTRERYLTHGRFSQKRFEAECLAEYAEVFPAVCGDFSFYQFPAPAFWRKLFAAAPAELRFALKVPEEVTVEVFPRQARYGARAGQQNPSYLSTSVFEALFLEPLEPYARRLGPLIFEFGARSTPARRFLASLGAFLEQLPRGFRYAVEVRNPEFLVPEYFALLRQQGVAHVLNAWTRMPVLSEQIGMEGAVTADFTVVRALLRQGRTYQEAVKRFTPYDRVQEENSEARKALRAILDRMRAERKAAYMFVNNRLEGNAPQTIQAVVK